MHFAELARKHSSQIYKCSLRMLQKREDAKTLKTTCKTSCFRLSATSTVSKANHNFQLGWCGSL